jgi:hypothetical protein
MLNSSIMFSSLYITSLYYPKHTKFYANKKTQNMTLQKNQTNKTTTYIY